MNQRAKPGYKELLRYPNTEVAADLCGYRRMATVVCARRRQKFLHALDIPLACPFLFRTLQLVDSPLLFSPKNQTGSIMGFSPCISGLRAFRPIILTRYAWLCTAYRSTRIPRHVCSPRPLHGSIFGLQGWLHRRQQLGYFVSAELRNWIEPPSMLFIVRFPWVGCAPWPFRRKGSEEYPPRFSSTKSPGGRLLRPNNGSYLFNRRASIF
jgi:hypothetical protein